MCQNGFPLHRAHVFGTINLFISRSHVTPEGRSVIFINLSSWAHSRVNRGCQWTHKTACIRAHTHTHMHIASSLLGMWSLTWQMNKKKLQNKHTKTRLLLYLHIKWTPVVFVCVYLYALQHMQAKNRLMVFDSLSLFSALCSSWLQEHFEVSVRRLTTFQRMQIMSRMQQSIYYVSLSKQHTSGRFLWGGKAPLQNKLDEKIIKYNKYFKIWADILCKSLIYIK